MAFTTCEKFSFVTAPKREAHYYFYPEDIAILLNQAGAKAIACIIAKPEGTEKFYPVLVAVKDTLAEINLSNLLIEPNHMMSLPCPPWGRDKFTGGQYLPDAKIDGSWP